MTGKPSDQGSDCGTAASWPVNPHLAALPPYNAGMSLPRARSLSGHHDIARLASNENPDGCSPGVLAALAGDGFEPWRYADPACTALRDVLAPRLGVDPDCIVFGNGSEEMIAAISRAILVPDSVAVTVAPSFGLHEIEPLAAGARVVKVPMTTGATFDMSALEDALSDGPRLVFLSTPWNPVGPALDHLALSRLIGAVRPGTLLVLDEAYFEFADTDAPDGIEVLRDSDIAHIVLRTFSKAYGLAGLRVGYAICSDPALARLIAAAKTPFNVNVAAQVAAIAALSDEAWMEASVARVRAERARVADQLAAIGLPPAPSQTNFLFLDTGRDSSRVAAELLADGIVVKPWREPGFENWLRMSIGRPAENDRFVASLTRLVTA